MKQIFNPLTGKFDAIGDVRESDIEEVVEHSITFTNAKSTPVDFGGIPAGTTFDQPTPITSIINDLLYPYVAPEVVISATNTNVEYGAPQASKLTIKITEKSRQIKSVVVRLQNNTILATFTRDDATVSQGVFTYTANLTADNVAAAMALDKKVYIVVTDTETVGGHEVSSTFTKSQAYALQYKIFAFAGLFNSPADINLSNQSGVLKSTKKGAGTYTINVPAGGGYLYFAFADGAGTIKFSTSAGEVDFDPINYTPTYNGLNYKLYRGRQVQNAGNVSIIIS